MSSSSRSSGRHPDVAASPSRRWRWNGLWRRGSGTPDDPNNGRLIFNLTGLDAWIYCRHFDTKLATVRGLYWWLIRRWKTELCGHCGRPVRIVYHAPDDIWEAATGFKRRPDGESAPGILCPACCDELAEAKLDGYLTWTCSLVEDEGEQWAKRRGPIVDDGTVDWSKWRFV